MYALREAPDEVDDREEVGHLADNIVASLRQHSQAADGIALYCGAFAPEPRLELVE